MAFILRCFTVISTFLIIAWMFFNEAQAQVTFSRDWNPGKRTENSDFAIKTASAVCHMLISQVRQLSACENRDDLDSGTTILNGGR